MEFIYDLKELRTDFRGDLFELIDQYREDHDRQAFKEGFNLLKNETKIKFNELRHDYRDAIKDIQNFIKIELPKDDRKESKKKYKEIEKKSKKKFKELKKESKKKYKEIEKKVKHEIKDYEKKEKKIENYENKVKKYDKKIKEFKKKLKKFKDKHDDDD